MREINSILRQKTELLCKGLYLDQDLINHYKKQGIDLDFGRKGGAGPLGGRYFLLEDKETLVNVALWDKPEKSNLILSRKKGDFFEVLNRDTHKHYASVILIENPKYYSPEYKTSDGIPMKKIALVHGTDCLATTVYQKCKYWACGEACKFCGIELSLKYDTTTIEKSAQQISEVITVAKKEGRCSHMTLTSGTEDTKDKGAMRYMNILTGIKNRHPDIPLHIQIEPMKNLEYIKILKNSGADTIGIHIELLDETLREEITPGKYRIPYKCFLDNWKYAVKVFGKNQVETFILTGFGGSDKIFKKRIKEIIKLGVIPFITPVRAIPSKKKGTPPTNYKELVKIYQWVSKLMLRYKLNPLKNKAGCVRCGGCSAISDYYKFLIKD
ncbi:MAG: radical SAM protein [Promethearchaeota archaeon]|nr:MAG: radical SAM protein [Candidatus Lokiarchaeota archaeon]